MLPAGRVEDLPPEVVQTGEVGDGGLAQRAGGPHQHRRDVLLAAGGPHDPAPGLVVPARLVHPPAEPQVPADVETVDALAHVVPDLALGGERARPVRVEGEGVRVEVRRHVAGGAGIRVVAPGAAHVVAPVEDDEVVDAHGAQAGRHADPGEARADDDDPVLVGHGVDATKEITTWASSSPQSSWRKWPPPTIVVWGWPWAPAMSRLRVRSRPPGDGVAVAEGAQEGPVEGGQAHPGGDVGVVGGVVRPRGHQQGEGPRSRLVGLVGEGRVVGRLDLGRHRLGAPTADDAAGRELLDLLGEALPAEEGLPGVGVAGGQEGVGRHDPGEPLRVLAHEAEADEPAPVLAHQRQVAQVEPVEEQLAHPLHVTGERVVAALGGLVRAAEPDQVGRHDLQPRCGERRDHLAVEVRPRGLAVHEEHDRCRGVALAQVVHAQGAPLAVGDVGVARLEVVAGQAGEPVVGGAEGVHAGRSLGRHPGGRPCWPPGCARRPGPVA